METTNKFKQLKTQCKRFVTSAWFKDTFGAFVATTLGIVITFGTSDYYASKEKEERAKTITRWTLRNIQTSINQLSAEAQKIEKADSVFKYFNHLYPDSLNYADTAMVEKFMQYMADYSSYAGDNTVEKIFSSSYTTWESISNDGFIDFVGTAFNVIDKTNADLGKIRKKRLSILTGALTADDISQINSSKEFTIQLMHKQEMRQFIMEHNINTVLIVQTINLLKQMQDEYMKELGLTLDDLYDPNAIEIQE